MNEVLRQIAGRETERADSVFKNLQMPGLKAMPAGQFLPAMNLGFARSLGISCAHCHIANDYSSDDKPAKQKAHAMMRMTNSTHPDHPRNTGHASDGDRDLHHLPSTPGETGNEPAAAA